MVDIHCHILPGLDDGAKTPEEAVEMTRIAVSDGITDIIATPHTCDGFYSQRTEIVLKSVTNLQQALDLEEIPLRIHPGSEVHVHSELLDHLYSGQILSLGNGMKHVLLEFPSVHFPLFSNRVVSHLLARGVTPVIAHPERIDVFRLNPSLLREWTEQGAIGQVTAGSLLGLFGRTARGCAIDFVKKRLVHVIASDGHHVRSRRPELSEAYKALMTMIPEEEVEMFRHNAHAILHGEALQILTPLTKSKQKRWFFF